MQTIVAIDECDSYEDDESSPPPIEDQICTSLRRFFNGLDWSAGGAIPKSEFYRPQHIGIVKRYSLVMAVDAGYAAIKAMSKRDLSLASTGKIKENTDVEIMLRVLRRCHRLRIPQEHEGGIFLLYLYLCEGIRLY